jgi:glucosamine--fructose-6-phosphate aminotransferase (isomerizing)
VTSVPARGETFLAETRDQPQALLRLLEQAPVYGEVARAAVERNPRIVRLVAHGSSDNAASYGVYAFGIEAGWTALRDSISLTVYYGARLELERSVVVALSQSGRTQDVVAYVERARERGALTIAVTNDPESDLARAAELTLPVAAGPENAVAASKTYVNQLAALRLLAGAIAGRTDEVVDEIGRTAESMAEAIPRFEDAVAVVAGAFAYVGRMFVVGRGIEFATAREIALKLTETCRVAAEPLTSTDLSHGPVAALDPLFPVWTIASNDEALPTIVEAARRARAAGATLVASGNAQAQIEGAAYRLPVPDAPSALLSPLLSVVPGQLFAGALASAKGLDSDHPEGLSKVTLAQ